MELVQVVVRRRTDEAGTELNIRVQTTPMGSLVAGAAVVWVGAKLWQLLRRRWWLPIGAGAVALLLKGLSASTSPEKEV